MNSRLYFKRICLILAIFTAQTFAGEPGNILSYTVHPASVEIQCTNARIRITAYTDDIFRMDIKPDTVIFDPLPFPELADSLLSFTFQIYDTPQTLTISSPKYSIEFQKFPFSFFIQNTFNEYLLNLENNGLQWGTDFSEIQFKMQSNDHFYGFGEKGIDLDRRGHAFGMRNQAFYGYSSPLSEMNINIPFFFSLQGYGMYFHMSYAGYFDMGKSNHDSWSYLSGGEIWMQFFVFVAKNPKEILRLYTQIAGRMPLPPAWAMGFLQSKYGYENETEARQVVNTFQQKGIPLDALILDLFWFTNMGDFQWDLNRFPNPFQMMADFRSQGVRTILITEPYFRDNSINFNSASNNGYFGQTSVGQTYVLPTFWYGPAALLDFTNPQAQTWCWNLYQQLVNQGVGGWWTDLCEPELHPDDMIHHWGEARRVHNIMNLLWSKLLYENYQQYPDRRLFNLTRSGYAGSQRYGAITWSGDVWRSFSGLAVQPVLMQSLALSGIPSHNSDIGGFAGPSTTPELYARWVQFGVFCPITRPHSSFQSVEPWAFTPEVEEIATYFIKLRETLFPYNYSHIYETQQTGLSIIRPLVVEYPNDPQTWNLGDEYLWGDAFLIAPILNEGGYPRDVYLPEGTWINFWTDQTYQGNQTINVIEPLSRMPVFIKAGSIIPRTPPRDFILQYPLDTLLVEIYPDNQGSFLLYEDDGLTKAYQSGAFALTNLTFNQLESTLTLSISPSSGSFSGQSSQRTYLYIIHLTDGVPDSVYWNGQLLTAQPDSLALLTAGQGWSYQPSKNQLLIMGINPTSQALSAQVFGFSSISKISPAQNFPKAFALLQNYPNPFNPATTIEFDLLKASKVSLKIYNILGEEVATLVSDRLNAGNHKYQWIRPVGMASGVYFYRLSVGSLTTKSSHFVAGKTENFTQTRKMLLIQ